jgi:hypothetical protein
MKTKTYFAFRVDIWDDTGDSIVEHVAGVDDFEVAKPPTGLRLRAGQRRGSPYGKARGSCRRAGSSNEAPPNLASRIRHKSGHAALRTRGVKSCEHGMNIRLVRAVFLFLIAVSLAFALREMLMVLGL